MSEMVERVAKALCHAKAYPESVWEAFQSEARTAIAAMREPTDAIRSVSTKSIDYSASEIWEAMIKAALK